MRRPRRRSRAVVYALGANAVLLAAILAALLSRSNAPSLLPAAYGLAPQPIAGGSGLYLMPGQFSVNSWGCYVMDVDTRTLCAYQFYPGEKQLRLIAARHFRHDLGLQDFNTTPKPAEVEQWGKLQRGGRRNADDAPRPGPIEVDDTRESDEGAVKKVEPEEEQ